MKPADNLFDKHRIAVGTDAIRIVVTCQKTMAGSCRTDQHRIGTRLCLGADLESAISEISQVKVKIVKKVSAWHPQKLFSRDAAHSVCIVVSGKATTLTRQQLHNRAILYANARAQNPERWSGKTRNWQPVGPVWLNPETEINAPEI